MDQPACKAQSNVNNNNALPGKSRFRVFTVHDPAKSFIEQPHPPDVLPLGAAKNAHQSHRTLTRRISTPVNALQQQRIEEIDSQEEEAHEIAHAHADYRGRSSSTKSSSKCDGSANKIMKSDNMANVDSLLTIDSREVPPLAHNYQLTDDRAKHMQHLSRPSLADLQHAFSKNNNATISSNLAAKSDNNNHDPVAVIERGNSAVRFSVDGGKQVGASSSSSNSIDFEAMPDDDYKSRDEETKGGKKAKKPYKYIFEPPDDDEAAECKRSARKQSTASSSSSTDPLSHKLGWVQGVFIRCLLNIFGVMLFVRLSWIVGQAGIGLSMSIEVFSTIITTLTALSMSAICTNGVVRGGGAYYMISRSLGAAFGGPIGVVLSVANAVSVAMHTVGFSETVNDLLEEHYPLYLTASRMNNVRIISASIVTLLLLVALSGTKWESRVQIFLLITLVLALLNFACGTVMPPSQVDYAKGFVGVGLRPLADNWAPRFEGGYSLVSIFAIFFPAATGLLAGSNISSELRDPGHAIPKGTVLAIAVSSVTYLVCIALFGASTTRDAPGPIIDDPHLNASLLLMPQNWYPSCEGFPSCSYGLSHDFRVMEMIAVYAPLVFLGIAAAALSSALTAIVSAPHVFQALCQDNLFPGLKFFGHGSADTNKPVRAFLLVYLVSLGFVMIGDLNLIAPVISSVFLLVYATINYACFDASWSKSPGFRPSFRFYSKWASLLGFALCLAAMFCISQWGALASIAAFCALWLYVRRVARPDVHWGSSMEANTYRGCLQEVYKLNKIDEHTKNYRPQVLVLSGYPANRSALIDIVSSFAGANSLLICGHVLLSDYSLAVRHQITWQAQQWLAKRRVKAFYSQLTSPNFELGARGLMEACGIGKLRPNILFLGYCDKWKTLPLNKITEYTRVLQHGFDCNMGVAVVKMNTGGGSNLHAHAFDDELPSFRIKKRSTCSTPGDKTTNKKTNICDNITFVNDEGSTPFSAGKTRAPTDSTANASSLAAIKTGIISHAEYAWLERFKLADKYHRKSIMQSSIRRSKEVHVWWLLDDGGLTVFLPHLLAKTWRCKLKVFYLSRRSTTALNENDDDFDNGDKKSRSSKGAESGKKLDSDSHTSEEEAIDNDANLKMLMKKLRINVRETVPVRIERPSHDEAHAMCARVRQQVVKISDDFNNVNATLTDDEKAEVSSEDIDENNGNKIEEKLNNLLLTDDDWNDNADRIIRQLCIGQQIQKHSHNAAVVFVSMPMPYRTMKPALYMTLLDCLTGEYDVADCFNTNKQKMQAKPESDERIGLLPPPAYRSRFNGYATSSSSSGPSAPKDIDDKKAVGEQVEKITSAHGKPPVILLRGNQQQVLTMYL